MQSSSRKSKCLGKYEINAPLSCTWVLPKLAVINELSADRYLIIGVQGKERAEPKHWRRPPHVELANLPASQIGSGLVDAAAAERFTSQYGVLCGLLLDKKVKTSEQRKIKADLSAGPEILFPGTEGLPKPRFASTSHEFGNCLQLLRRAWEGVDSDQGSVRRIQAEAIRGGLRPMTEGVEFAPAADGAGIELRVNNLWSYICLLFLIDAGAGKIGKCANPGCDAPYFLKSRRNQKFCETGECVVWAQRQYALNWWHREHGKPNRSRAK
jgi:hypothetical protein